MIYTSRADLLGECRGVRTTPHHKVHYPWEELHSPWNFPHPPCKISPPLLPNILQTDTVYLQQCQQCLSWADFSLNKGFNLPLPILKLDWINDLFRQRFLKYIKHWQAFPWIIKSWTMNPFHITWRKYIYQLL